MCSSKVALAALICFSLRAQTLIPLAGMGQSAPSAAGPVTPALGVHNYVDFEGSGASNPQGVALTGVTTDSKSTLVACSGGTNVTLNNVCLDGSTCATPNKFTQVSGSPVSGTAQKLQCFTFAGYSGSSSPTVSFNWASTPTYVRAAVIEVRTNGFDTSGSSTSVSNDTPPITPFTANISPSANTEIVISCLSMAGGSATWSVNTSDGWTLIDNTANSNGACAYKLPTDAKSEIGSASYTSGPAVTGGTATYCALSAFNGTGGSGAAGQIYLTGTNAIASGTPIYMTSSGTGYTGTSTAATQASGNATCTAGSATIATSLGIGNGWSASTTNVFSSQLVMGFK